jgi:hypothetical protein
MSPQRSLLEELKGLEIHPNGVDWAMKERRQIESLERLCRYMHSKTLKDVADQQTAATVLNILSGTSMATAVGVANLVGELMRTKITDPALGKVAGQFMIGIVELLRNDLTDKQGFDVLEVLRRSVKSSPPHLSELLLQDTRLATIAQWLKVPNSGAAPLIEAIANACKESIDRRAEPFRGGNRANVLPWIQALQAGVTEAACLGLAIHTVGASDEDVAFLAKHLQSGTSPPVLLLVKAAESAFAPKSYSQPGFEHTASDAMLVMERCAAFLTMTNSFNLESFIPFCISLMELGNDAEALLAAHTFTKSVEAVGIGAGPFLSEQPWAPALVNVLGRDCVMCKNAGALAIMVLLKHLSGKLVITMLTQAVPLAGHQIAPNRNPAGKAFAKALIAAIEERHSKPDKKIPEMLRPFNWQPSAPPPCGGLEWSPHLTSLQILQEAATLETAARLLAAEGIASTLQDHMKHEEPHLAPLLADVYLCLVENTSALPANPRKDPMLLKDPEWLLFLTGSEVVEVQGASLSMVAELVSQGLVLNDAACQDLADRVLVILEQEQVDLFRPAALALAAILCKYPELSDYLRKHALMTGPLPATLAAKRPWCEVSDRAGGAAALEALLTAHPAWANHVLEHNPATGTDSGVAGDLLDLLSYVGNGVTELEKIKVRACTDKLPLTMLLINLRHPEYGQLSVRLTSILGSL